MNKFTKIILGTGLAGAALLGAAMPASAADTTTTAAAAAADRVTGVIDFVNDMNRGLVKQSRDKGANNLTVWISHQTNPDIPVTAWELPAIDSVGPIVGTEGRSDGLCMTDVDGNPIWAECDGSPSQQFQLTDAAFGQTSGYAIESISRPGSFVSESSSSGATVLRTLSTTVLFIQNYADLTPVAPEVTPVDITGPSGTTDDSTPTFSGTGEPGAAIVVKDSAGNELCSTTVGTDGNWACDSTVELADGTHEATAEQTDANGDKTSDAIEFIVAEDGDTPAIDPALAGGAGMLALAIGGVVFARRRKTAATQA